MLANCSACVARVAAASPAATTQQFTAPHIPVSWIIGGAAGLLLLIILLFRLTRRQHVTIHNHHPAPVVQAPAGGDRRSHKLRKLLIAAAAAAVAAFAYTTVNGHGAATATAQAPVATPTPSPSATATHSVVSQAPKVITRYVNAHPLISGTDWVIIACAIIIGFLGWMSLRGRAARAGE